MIERGFEIRSALPEDHDAICVLLPRLASFELPADRNPEHLWTDDAKLLARWAAGDAEDCFVHVAEGDDGAIIGVVMTSLRPELLSHEPSAHLEALVVAGESEGRGVGGALIDAAEDNARACGARSMTLHAFECNVRARRVYEKRGYYGELIRYRKNL